MVFDVLTVLFLMVLAVDMALPAFCAKITLITGGGCGCGG